SAERGGPGRLLGREAGPAGRTDEQEDARGGGRVHVRHAEQLAVGAALGKPGGHAAPEVADARHGERTAPPEDLRRHGAREWHAATLLGRALAGRGGDLQLPAALDDELDDGAIGARGDERALGDRAHDLVIREGGGHRLGGAAEGGLLVSAAFGLGARGIELALRPALIRDVLGDAEDADGAAGLDHGHEPRQDVPALALARLDLELDALRLAAQRAVEGLPYTRALAARHHGREPAADEPPGGVAEESLRGRVGAGAHAVGVEGEGGVRVQLEKRAIALLVRLCLAAPLLDLPEQQAAPQHEGREAGQEIDARDVSRSEG